MRGHNIAYLFKEGFRNLFHNKLMSFACIGVLMACLLLIGGAAMFSINVNSIVQYVEDQNEIVAFLSDSMEQGDIDVLTLKLGKMENILQVTFISKEQALEGEKEKMGEFASLLDGLEETNPLPDTFIIRIDDLAKLEQTVGQLRDMDGIEKVNAQTEVATILTGIKKTVTVAGISIVIILVVVSVVIITNTIKLTVFSRRKEINIMKYVGATDTFIRMPFVVEGMMIGLIAALLAFGLLWGGYWYLLKWIGENYGPYIGPVYANTVDFVSVAPYVLGGFSILGIFIGMVGSGMFIRKYLKV
ncbi:permease-like cell division protein FtsX [Oscillospiraceae bacterium MB08-C2-2]|nr:permease-like cell division protein FtsX [Oscillospiraceae bacterium MB08-C2-2]